jgi:hypothetical protein
MENPNLIDRNVIDLISDVITKNVTAPCIWTVCELTWRLSTFSELNWLGCCKEKQRTDLYTAVIDQLTFLSVHGRGESQKNIR